MFDAVDVIGCCVVLIGFDIENIVCIVICFKKLFLVNESFLIKLKDMFCFEDYELIIFEIGCMGEFINGFCKMLIGCYCYVEIKDGDLVYIVIILFIVKEVVMVCVENMIY